MSWIIGFISFLIGAAAGALLFRAFRSDEAKVLTLELKLQKLSEEHENYKNNVHSHFSNTAKLFNDMTESYRNVYLHMANGAQTLCPDYISSQLALSGDAKALLNREDNEADSKAAVTPPLDYAARVKPDQKGTLAEDYGIEKPEDY